MLVCLKYWDKTLEKSGVGAMTKESALEDHDIRCCMF